MSVKKNVFIHIGNHKTGTSSLQFFFTEKAKHLLKLDLLYPIEKKTVNHHNISWQSIKHFYFDKSKQTINTLFQTISKNKKYNILISSENFENLKFSKEFNRFIIQIKKTHNLKIIWSIREQFSYSLSLLTMLINKGAYLKNFDSFIDNILKKGMLSFKPYIFWFDYYEQYKRISKIFNVKKKDIFLIVYSKEKNIFEDFLKRISINIKVKRNTYYKNVSKSLFQNDKNVKNWIKKILKYNKNYFNKSIINDKSPFFYINKKKKLIFSKNDILIQKYRIMNSFKNKNLKLFKTFKISKKEIREFYNEH
tara:strand:+ start:453 stop:1376 length:924 start_codon:yes stop_codon:yes gene_type:complete